MSSVAGKNLEATTLLQSWRASRVGICGQIEFEYYRLTPTHSASEAVEMEDYAQRSYKLSRHRLAARVAGLIPPRRRLGSLSFRRLRRRCWCLEGGREGP